MTPAQLRTEAQAKVRRFLRLGRPLSRALYNMHAVLYYSRQHVFGSRLRRQPGGLVLLAIGR